MVESAAGGVARYLADLLPLQVDDGFDVTVLYSPGRTDAAWRRAEAALAAKGVALATLGMRREVGLWDLGDALKLRRWVRGQAPFDVVHAHSSKAGALVRMAFPGRGAKVYTPNAFATMSTAIGPRKRAAYATFERLLSRSGGVTMLVSEDELAHARGLRLPESKLRMVPMGMAIAPTGEREAARGELGLSSEETVVGFVGRFWDQKDPTTAVRAFAAYARVGGEGVLVMVGYGDGARDVEAAAAREGIADRVRLVLDGDAPKLMPAFDALLMTSLYESFGYVLLEAAVNGVPCVATPVGIAPPLAEAGGATLFPVGDHEAAARALAAALAPEARAGGSARARAAAERFSDRAMHAGVKGVYGEVAGASGERRSAPGR